MHDSKAHPLISNNQGLLHTHFYCASWWKVWSFGREHLYLSSPLVSAPSLTSFVGQTVLQFSEGCDLFWWPAEMMRQLELREGLYWAVHSLAACTTLVPGCWGQVRQLGEILHQWTCWCWISLGPRLSTRWYVHSVLPWEVGTVGRKQGLMLFKAGKSRINAVV